MKNKNLALLGVAIGCGLVAAFVTAQLGAKSVQLDTVEVPVARRELPQGTKLVSPEALFEKKQVPTGLIPPETITDLAEVKGKILSKTIKMNSPVQRKDFSATGTVDLPEGTQAFGLKVSAEVMAGGLILPGARVDVLWLPKVRVTDPRSKREKDTIMSRVLLQDMLIVAVDSGTNRPEDRSGIQNPSVVSLAVTSNQAQKLALAARSGDLTLTLRQAGDKTVAESLSMKDAYELLNPAEEPKEEEALKIPVAVKDIPANTKIEVFDDWFEMKPVNPKPSSAVESLDDLVGKFVTKPIYAEQWVPRTLVADKADEPEPVVVEKPQVAPPPVAPAPRKRNLHLLTIQEGNQKPRTIIYEDGRAQGGSDVYQPPAKKADKGEKAAEPEAAPPPEEKPADGK